MSIFFILKLSYCKNFHVGKLLLNAATVAHYEANKMSKNKYSVYTYSVKTNKRRK